MIITLDDCNDWASIIQSLKTNVTNMLYTIYVALDKVNSKLLI